jgi:hypothetical protein
MNNILNIANLARPDTMNALDYALYQNTKGNYFEVNYEIVGYDAEDSDDGKLKVTLEVQVSETVDALREALENELDESDSVHFSISDAEKWKETHENDLAEFLTQDQAYHFLKEQRDDIASNIFHAVALDLFGDEVESYEIVEELMNRNAEQIEFQLELDVKIELSNEDIVQVAKEVASTEAA